jgi:HAD superfamily hydrolase (TIGR01549 family)
MRTVHTILFDMGGTLDGDGVHWLDRFITLYRNFGIELPRGVIRAAFDEAERKSLQNENIASANFEEMVELHVNWQLAYLGLQNEPLIRRLAQEFIRPVRNTATRNACLLADLADRGFKLGVVSNGCGNVAKLCSDFGYTPYLSTVVDSRCVGLSKPDPAIFFHAAEELGAEPTAVLMVGDSFERDIRPAKQTGMKTAWLAGAQAGNCPDPSLVDLRLLRLADLSAALPAHCVALT